MNLSAIVITKNEERNIERCLASVSFADEIIVVDAESQDRTAELARKAGATVFVRSWPGYGEQKNFGREQAHGDWLLFIDADEKVSAELAQEIQKVVSSQLSQLRQGATLGEAVVSSNFYWLRIVTVFLGKPLHHLYGHNPRPMRRNSGRWTDSNVHEQVETNMGQQITLGDQHSAILSNGLLHYSHPTIQSYMAKMHTYTTLDAKQMLRTKAHRSGRPVKPRIWLPIWLALRQFIKLLIYRRGIWDGLAGITWCVLSAYYEFEMGQKYVRGTRL